MISTIFSDGPLEIGSRLELFTDDTIIARMSGGAELRLNRPVPQEVVMVMDKPWEGNACGLLTIFQDEDIYRMYYLGNQYEIKDKALGWSHPHFICYAESEDGILWQKPELGLVEFDGSKKNNILFAPNMNSSQDEKKKLPAEWFAPFKDTNSDAASDAKYKAWGLGFDPMGLYPFKSPDGIHWTLMSDKPVITYGNFDSQNLAFWDAARGEYRDYHRNKSECKEVYCAHREASADGLRGSRVGRDILTATSKDFIHWTDPVYIHYTEGRTHELYTNGILPYIRAPHILLGFPMRYVERKWSDAVEDLPEIDHRRLRADAQERFGSAVTDSMFMSSRDGLHFKLWPESFIRPGLRPENNWTYADNQKNWGLVFTRSTIADAPDEISMYTIEGFWRGHSVDLRRHTLRVDGFVSVQAPLSGGELVTRPLIFEGAELVLNFSASAAGSVRVEILADQADIPIDGYTLDDCREILGDDLDRKVYWSGSPDVGRLAGIPIRLRFVLKDADLYAFRFRDSASAE